MEKEKFLRRFKGFELYEGAAGVEIYKKSVLVHIAPFVVEGVIRLNKGIEDAKEWVLDQSKVAEAPKAEEETQPAAGAVDDGPVFDPLPVRKCRVCGCTQDDCRQCIEKTGKACHWVEYDLCSACVEEKPIAVVDTRASQAPSTEIPKTEENYSANQAENIPDDIPKKLEEPLPAGDSFFFQQLATFGNVDMTMRIMKVNGKFTIGVTPGDTVKGMKRVSITGTPEEFDREFISTLMPKMKEVPGLIFKVEEVKPGEKPKAETKPAASKPARKPAVKKSSPPKKKEVKKPVAKKAAAPKAKPPKKSAKPKKTFDQVKKEVKEKQEAPPPAEQVKAPAVEEQTLL